MVKTIRVASLCYMLKTLKAHD